jgi:hypothetical protein
MKTHKGHIHLGHLLMLTKEGLDKVMTDNTESKHHDIDILYDLIRIDAYKRKKIIEGLINEKRINLMIAEAVCSVIDIGGLINWLWEYDNDFIMAYKYKKWNIRVGNSKIFKGYNLLTTLWEAYADINGILIILDEGENI